VPVDKKDLDCTQQSASKVKQAEYNLYVTHSAQDVSINADSTTTNHILTKLHKCTSSEAT